jgi:hypothetical protein
MASDVRVTKFSKPKTITKPHLGSYYFIPCVTRGLKPPSPIEAESWHLLLIRKR